jgi:hypothetical protein
MLIDKNLSQKEGQLVIIVFLEKSTSLSRKGDKLMA